MTVLSEGIIVLSLKKALGPEHTSTLNTVSNLENDQGRSAGAEKMEERKPHWEKRTLPSLTQFTAWGFCTEGKMRRDGVTVL